MSYDVRGRLERVEIDSDGDGNLDSITRYEYNDDGIRVISEKIDPSDGTTVLERTIFHIDPNNHTGYAQVLEEGVDADNDGKLDVNEIDTTYTIGHDVIAQATSAALHFLLYDGHGSARVLIDGAQTDPALMVLQRYAYDAYGNMLSGAGLTLEHRQQPH